MNLLDYLFEDYKVIIVTLFKVFMRSGKIGKIPMPTANIWWAHTGNPNRPMDNIAKIISKLQKASFFALSR